MCSFELKNEVVLSTMLTQFAGINLSEHTEKFDFYADRFEDIPLYLQTYFGSTELDRILEIIDYAIYAYDIGHIVIDNLQFMLSGQGRGFERLELQDLMISKLRKLATDRNVHVTLVIHPRKSDDSGDLNIHDIFGTAKSTQEADNVMIIQNRDRYKVMDVKKNRYDGEIGKVSLWFDKNGKRFEQMSSKEIEGLLNGVSVDDMLEARSEGEEGARGQEFDDGLELAESVDCGVSKKTKIDDEISRIMMRMERVEKNEKNKQQVASDIANDSRLSVNQRIDEMKTRFGLDEPTNVNVFDEIETKAQPATRVKLTTESQTFGGEDLGINVFDELEAKSSGSPLQNSTSNPETSGIEKFSDKYAAENSQETLDLPINVFDEYMDPQPAPAEAIQVKEVLELEFEEPNMAKLPNSVETEFEKEKIEQFEARDVGSMLDHTTIDAKESFYAEKQPIMTYDDMIKELTQPSYHKSTGDYEVNREKRKLEAELHNELLNFHEEDKK
jgi:hypothetical protein